ncbi:thioredoxin-like protein [Xylariaceae sp. FL1019]|nr:thioredoxin-like protein [Xylariaceae sp. FL1019]
MSPHASLKPIIVHGHLMGPNPLKVRMVLEELEVPFEYREIEWDDMKKAPYIDINPNGRVPAIEDPNTGLTIFESGPIVEYLAEEYDKDHKLSYATRTEQYQIKQWIALQISGQGPYYGQYVWFSVVHPEKFPSAIERYRAEAERVRSVVDLHLSRQAGEKQGERAADKHIWLVGDKMTIADLSWFIWEQIINFLMGVNQVPIPEGKYPHYDAWYKAIEKRPSAQRAIDSRNRGIAKMRAERTLPGLDNEDGKPEA